MTVSFTWNIPLTFQANNPQGVAVNVSVSIGQPYISNINGQPVKSPEQERYDRQREWDDWVEQERILRQQQRILRLREERQREEWRQREEEKIKQKRQNNEISKVNWTKEGF